MPRPGAKTLVYAFGPYAEFHDNVSAAVIARLRPRRGLVREVFETRFSRTMFLRVLRRHVPDIVIGLGQHRTAHKLRLERKAVNRMGRRGAALRPIDAHGPAARFVNLHLPHTPETTVSYDAGTYVCNFSMYLVIDYCRRNGCRFAFVHIPRGHDAAAVAAYVGEAIRAAGLNRPRPGRS